MIDIPPYQPKRLERFGVNYLQLFRKIDSTHSVFHHSDAELGRRIAWINFVGIWWSCVVGIVCVFPTVWIDLYLQNEPFMIHYGWVTLVTIVSIAIEFYLLFVIALKAVHEVGQLINIHATHQDFMNSPLFSVQHILSRTALEIPDPELQILGIDPFKRISKKNLFILGLIYKWKIFLTNQVVKYGLLFSVGKTLFQIPIMYACLPVECFWNGVVLRRVVLEARLRLFGFALANRIAADLANEKTLEQLSPLAKTGCLRAIGNAVVMAKNHHPNMILLLMRFQQALRITEPNQYDDWQAFLQTLQQVTPEERFFLLDLFTVSAAFDGRLSDLEKESLQAAYGAEFGIYHQRLVRLTHCLKKGLLHEALGLCRLDFKAG